MFLLFQVAGFLNSLKARLGFCKHCWEVGWAASRIFSCIGRCGLARVRLVLSGMCRMNCLTFCQSMCVLCCGFGGHGSLTSVSCSGLLLRLAAFVTCGRKCDGPVAPESSGARFPRPHIWFLECDKRSSNIRKLSLRRPTRQRQFPNICRRRRFVTWEGSESKRFK